MKNDDFEMITSTNLNEIHKNSVDEIFRSLDQFKNKTQFSQTFLTSIEKFLLSSLAFSFNQPEFCPTASWNTNPITFANISTYEGRVYPFFVTKNNTIYVIYPENNTIVFWHEDNSNSTSITVSHFRISYTLFVTLNGDIFFGMGEGRCLVARWKAKTNTFDIVINMHASPCNGLFVDTNETLYCSMTRLHQVVKRWLNDRDTTSMTVAAGTGDPGSALNELDEPAGIFVDMNFDLYVADLGNNRVQLFSSGQSNGITVAGKLSPIQTIDLFHPTEIILDAEKYLFILDMGNSRIVGSSSNGFRCLVGCYGMGEQSNQLDQPISFHFDRFGNLLVVNGKNNRIQRFDYLNNSCSSGNLKRKSIEKNKS